MEFGANVCPESGLGIRVLYSRSGRSDDGMHENWPSESYLEVDR